MEFKIEKNVPIGHSNYEFITKLEIGDSFLVDSDKARSLVSSFTATYFFDNEDLNSKTFKKL